MLALSIAVMIIHLFGMAFGVGGATVKLILLLRTNSNHELLPVYFKVAKTITKLIVTGMVLLTLSGIAWLFMGYSFTTLLIIKVVFVGLIWLLGPVIDNLLEPKFESLALVSREKASPEFVRIRKLYLSVEILATALMYAITIMGVLL